MPIVPGVGWVYDAGNPTGGGPVYQVGETGTQGQKKKRDPARASTTPSSASLTEKDDPVSKEREEAEGLLPKYKQASEDYYDKYEKTGQTYTDTMTGAETGYQGRLTGLMDEAQRMGTMADETYADVSGRQKGIMDKAQTEAGSAMTLAESMDPNNQVAQGFRDFYDQRAQGTRQAGMADVGVMQALGAQAFGGQMSGAGPMTGGQMAAMMGQNQSQSGMAMANVQRRVADLQDQGIAQGWEQTDKAYGRGQEARDYYDRSVRNFDDSHTRYQGLSAGLRGEREGYGQSMLGSQGRSAGYERDFGMDTGSLRHALDTGDLDRTMATITGEYDRRAADRDAARKEAAARYAAQQGTQGAMMGGLMGIAGSGLQGYLSGGMG